MSRILAENKITIMEKLDKDLDKKRDLLMSSFQDWRADISKIIRKIETITLKEMVFNDLLFHPFHVCHS